MAPDLNIWALIFEKAKPNNERGIIVINKWKKGNGINGESSPFRSCLYLFQKWMKDNILVVTYMADFTRFFTLS